ncbi:Penicillin amidase [Streptosporangium canum]|uniref:Penicillin amidase n=1 Tax=Streptosporangium canum TaxID=324952 RepID=A0A1I3N1J4_9ACTN|nr:penicillin acylase family protein [Streptosporangium canum]SFJ02786.1 Penicillin amidase [Streptosporangium canum]
MTELEIVRADDWVAGWHAEGRRQGRTRARQLDHLRHRARTEPRQLRLGVGDRADRLVDELPDEQRTELIAFAEGVAATGVPGWTAGDSLAVGIFYAQELSTDGTDIAAEQTLRVTLPESVADLLLPTDDPYATDLFGAAIPAEPGLSDRQRDDVRAVLATAARSWTPLDRTPMKTADPWGSNVWARVHERGTVFANDLHLPLTHPSLLCPVHFAVGGDTVIGFVMIGLPAVASGTNGTLAWGVTRLAGYTVADGRWAVLEPGGYDLTLSRIARSRDLAEALDLAATSGGPALNVVIADGTRIGWTCGGAQWDRTGTRLADPAYRPRLVRDSGVIVNANNASPQHRTDDTTPIGRNHFPAVRARRIADVLTGRAELPGAPEDLDLALQLDDDAAYYSFYRDLLTRIPVGANAPAELRAAVAAAKAWDGRSTLGSVGLPLLAVYRECLRDALFGPLLHACVQADPAFAYAWHNHEHALHSLLTAGIVPPPFRGASAFHRTQAGLAAAMVRRMTGLAADKAAWGAVSGIGLVHSDPSRVHGEDRQVPGCAEAVRSHRPGFGAAMRLTVRLEPGRGARVAWQLAGRIDEAGDDDLLQNWADGVPARIDLDTVKP